MGLGDAGQRQPLEGTKDCLQALTTEDLTMKTVATWLVAAALALGLLAACGGGGGGEGGDATTNRSSGGGSQPVPPTPPADLSGPIGLTQLADYPTLGFAYRYTSNSDGSQPQGPATPDAAEVISFSYLAADQSYEMTIPGLEPGRLSLRNANAYGSVHTLSTAPSPTFEVVLHRPGSANTEMPLQHTSFGWWEDPIYTPLPAIQRSNHTGYFAYGVPTAPADVPTNGSVQYRSVVFGATSASLGVWYVFGDARMAFDFASGRLTGDLTLGVNPGGPGHRSFGTFALAGTRDAADATRFSGRFIMPGGVEDGYFEGRFTGPQAGEMMVRWLLPQAGSANTGPGSLFGVWVGRRSS